MKRETDYGQSITLLGSCAMSSIRLAYIVALAEKRGVNLNEVHGSVTEYPFCSTFGQTDAQPLDLNLKLWLDSSEYIVRNKIHMRSGILSQHFQESGGNNAHALAVEMAMLKELLGLLKKNNLDDICVICGGTIPKHQIQELKNQGVSEIFPPQSTSESIINYIVSKV